MKSVVTAVLVLMLVTMFLLVIPSCEKTGEEKAKIAVEIATERLNTLREQLPDGATEVKDVGNGWCTFSWQNRQFLFRFQQYRGSSRGYESSAIVELSPK